MISELENHLWQSTLFAGVVGLLTLVLRQNRAAARHALWLAASVKFLIPFSLLIAVGSQVEWREAQVMQPEVSFVMEQFSQPFALPSRAPSESAPKAPSRVPAVLFCLWLCGFGANGLAWWRRWRRMRMILRSATPLPLNLPIKVMSSPSGLEPGVLGIRKPLLLLPDGIVDHLTPGQLQAILAHELCHVRRRDNLAAAVHMLVEALFWFHPVVWWIQARLVEERERACDEEVLGIIGDPQEYAEGILSVCKFYLESPLACVSGVTGSNLKRRVEAIMMGRRAYALSFGRKLLLTVGGILSVTGPIIIGALNAPMVRGQFAQAKTARPEFEVASVRPTQGTYPSFGVGGGEGGGSNVTLKTLIAFAYQIQEYRIAGGPGWIDSDRFDVKARAADRKTPPEQLKVMLQSLFADRFKLVVHREIKESNVYNLVVAKGGPKIKLSADQTSPDVNGPSAPDAGPNHGAIRIGSGSMIGNAVPLSRLVNLLSQRLDRLVVDKTSLTGRFDIRLQWTPEVGENPLDPAGVLLPSEPGDHPSIFVAIQEQLGLKLEAAKGPVDFLVIDHVEQPTPN